MPETTGAPCGQNALRALSRGGRRRPTVVPRPRCASLQVLHQRRTADLDPYPVIAQIAEVSDFFAEAAHIVHGIAVSATDLDGATSSPCRRSDRPGAGTAAGRRSSP